MGMYLFSYAEVISTEPLIQKRRLVVNYEKLPERARIFYLYCYGSFNVKATRSK